MPIYLPALLRKALPARIATTSIAKALRAGRRANGDERSE